MDDLTAFLKQKGVREAIRLFQWMANNGSTLRDYGPTKPLLLGGDLRDEFSRTDIETLCDLGFLLPERVQKDGIVFTEFKLTKKAERLIREIKNRETEEIDLPPQRPQDRRFWIVVLNGSIFIDLGIAPPNLRALMGEAEWNAGDRIVVTCHDPDSLLVSQLPLALASEVYGGLSGHQIDEIESIATDVSHSHRDSRP